MKNEAQDADKQKIKFHKGRPALVEQGDASKVNKVELKPEGDNSVAGTTDEQEGINEEKEQREKNHHPKRSSKMRRK